MTTASETPSRLRELDYSVVQQCMHCGLCLPTCPTYEATQLERHSPRGRIALMRAIADGRMPVSRGFGEEMSFCLGCLACMSACPAGVNYAALFEHARAEVEDRGVLNSPFRRALRWGTLRWLFMDLDRLKLLGRGMRLYQQSGLQRLLRASGLMGCLPKRWREWEGMMPVIQLRFTAEEVPPTTPSESPRGYRVLVLSGCAQDLIFSDVNRDTVEVLTRNGCEVDMPAEQSCCGSLHAHNGDWDAAKELAQYHLETIDMRSYDAIITNAAGCGSHLKHYSNLFRDDSRLVDAARLWDSKVKDIHEWLVEIGFRPPRAAGAAQVRVTYHEACHLCHGQAIVREPRLILASIPGLELIELSESTWCCGSAGIYNLTQPGMANALLERKMDHILSTGATVVATGNPGCLLQLQNGVRRRNKALKVVHPVSLLAAAYRLEKREMAKEGPPAV